MISRLRRRIGSVARREAGFTLIELMIVIAVLGILAGIAIPKLGGVRDKAKDAEFTSISGTIRNSMEMYYAEQGNYPASADITSYSDLNTELDTVEIPSVVDGNVDSYKTTNSGENYELKITHPETGTQFTVTKDEITKN